MAGDPHGLLARAAKPGFSTWLNHAARLKGCQRPIRLAGNVTTLDATGAIVDSFSTDDLPDGILYKPCGTRFASLCPACSETYRWDTYQLIKSGLVGGKGVPATTALHPAVFATLTAPSFGPVHTRLVDRAGKPKPCRPRRERPVCSHGQAQWCSALHRDGDHRLGKPLCLDCYDHDHQAVWNHFAPKLWDRTILRVRRLVAAELGPRLADITRVSYVKVAELQARAAVHLHALIRFDGRDPDAPNDIVAPPSFGLPDGSLVQVLTADRLAELVVQAARDVGLTTPAHPDRAEGWPVVWGEQVDARVIRRGLIGGELTESYVAGYLAKYATKGSESTGLVATRITPNTIHAYRDRDTHIGRCVDACWRLGRYVPDLALADQNERPYGRLRRWAHLYGYGGHFSSKSRRYGTTLGKLRRARTHAARALAQGLAPTDHDLIDDQAATVVIAQWRYAGAGWLTTGDAALATMAADAARKRRPAGLNHPETA
jgi:hypothetical protein